ncbi:hypothetical protein Q1695_015555 [Nippostrongylus brasiliensis]|nr:hypothetical protein Q1695_015555 [Nippostrongylus brasiliensis]
MTAAHKEELGVHKFLSQGAAANGMPHRIRFVTVVNQLFGLSSQTGGGAVEPTSSAYFLVVANKSPPP